MFSDTESIVQNTPHIQIERGEYYAQYSQGHEISLWIWIML